MYALRRAYFEFRRNFYKLSIYPLDRTPIRSLPSKEECMPRHKKKPVVHEPEPIEEMSVVFGRLRTLTYYLPPGEKPGYEIIDETQRV
jgi:hypothetical protein